MNTEDLDRLEEREKQILWVSGYYKEQGIEPGSFYKALIKAFFRADRRNRARLSLAFPVTGLAFVHYMSGSLKEKYDLPDD